jgi:hypothetical protein
MGYSNTPVFFGGISGVVTTLVANSPSLGDRILYGQREYVYVHNSGNSDIPPTYAIVPATGATGYSGTISSVARDPMFGVVVHATLPTGAYGWVCYRGSNVRVGVASAIATGAQVALSTARSFVTWTTMTTDGVPVGKVLVASSGSTAVADVYLNC